LFGRPIPFRGGREPEGGPSPASSKEWGKNFLSSSLLPEKEVLLVINFLPQVSGEIQRLSKTLRRRIQSGGHLPSSHGLEILLKLSLGGKDLDPQNNFWEASESSQKSLPPPKIQSPLGLEKCPEVSLPRSWSEWHTKRKKGIYLYYLKKKIRKKVVVESTGLEIGGGQEILKVFRFQTFFKVETYGEKEFTGVFSGDPLMGPPDLKPTSSGFLPSGEPF